VRLTLEVVIFDADFLISASIVFASTGLFVYWVTRAVLVLRGRLRPSP
jgi:hypothetical protein